MNTYIISGNWLPEESKNSFIKRPLSVLVLAESMEKAIKITRAKYPNSTIASATLQDCNILTEER